MAYNREWDRGKDSWYDNSWGGDSRGDNRGRDDDYYGEGKRRKFNAGGYDSSYGYDDGSNNAGFHHKSDYQDYGQDDRHRGGGSGFNKKRMIPSEPSPHVIFLGLDPDFTEADLQAYLTSQGCSIETVTIIRERTSITLCLCALIDVCPSWIFKGSSKGFGFAQFTSVEHARAFVDPLFPFIQVPPPASHGASATANFYKALETGTPHNGRRVKIDYSQSASHGDRRFNRANANDGTRDIGNTQAPVLLFRGLDPLSGPQAIHQAMLYSSGPNKKSGKGMKRIILIKDKVTMASFGFAFVEFIDIQSASAVLAATMSPQIHPNGFRISDRPVAASFAHPYSFQPVTDFLSRDEACLTSSISLGGVEGTWVRYWDESATVAVLEFEVDEATQAASNATKEKEKEKEKKKKPKVKEGPAAPSALPVSDKPVTLSFSKGPVKPNAGPVKPALLSMDDGSNNELPDNTDEPAANPSKAHQVKKVAPLIASKKATSVSTGTTSTRADSTPPPETEFEFSDVAALMCLLCARQFKSLDQLKRHNKESDLHKARNLSKNYKDGNLREVARQKLQARKADEQPKYRDRALERRTLFNQPDTPVPEGGSNKPNKKRQSEGPPPRPSPPAPALNPGEDTNNVGNKLLKMMGWKEGMGLGTEGDGRTEPIVTAIYAQGVGLGAAKAREVGKFSDGYSGYVQQAQEAVSNERKSGDAFSILSTQNDVLNFAIHIRLANATKAEAYPPRFLALQRVVIVKAV
ncbi:RNA-binding protein 5-A [Leucoagaricus sp. SymC.cos]|nr:RNA-binding protein 5-A [Leucoagaricus sp. SymC.cos]